MKITAWSLIIGLAIASAACGDSMSSLNPTAPSALAAVRGESLSAEAGAGGGVAGSMGKKDKDKDKKKNQPPSNTSPGTTVVPLLPGLSKVEIEGSISAVGTGSITVNEHTVMVTGDTVIRHGNERFEFSDLHAGDRVHVKAMRVAGTANGGDVTLRAIEVKLQRDGDAEDEEDEEEEDEEEEDEEDDEDETADLPSVTVQASDSSASESGRNNTGTFRVSRSGSKWAAPISVTFTLTGTATNGTDYASVPLTVTFERGDDRVNVVVRPTADTLTEGTETVVVTLTPGSSYRLGSASSATISISDR